MGCTEPVNAASKFSLDRVIKEGYSGSRGHDDCSAYPARLLLYCMRSGTVIAGFIVMRAAMIFAR